MKAISNSGKSLPVGKSITVFTNNPQQVGTEFNVYDRAENVVNVARVTHVQLSSDLNVKLGKYAVNAQVVQDMSTEQQGTFTTRLYWT